jgi:hypothetical protein
MIYILVAIFLLMMMINVSSFGIGSTSSSLSSISRVRDNNGMVQEREQIR